MKKNKHGIILSSFLLFLLIFSCTANDETNLSELKSETGHLNLAGLRKQFGFEEEFQLKIKQFTGAEWLDENSGNIIYLEKQDARKAFDKLISSGEYVIEFDVFDHVTDNWIIESTKKNNWHVFDGFKYERDDGYVDYCFAVKPADNFAGIEVLRTEEKKGKSKLPNTTLYLWFAGDSPNLERLSGKKIAMLNTFGKFYRGFAHVQNPKLRELFTDVRFKKKVFSSEKDAQLFVKNMHLFYDPTEETIDHEIMIFTSILRGEE